MVTEFRTKIVNLNYGKMKKMLKLLAVALFALFAFSANKTIGGTDICVSSNGNSCTVVWWKCITASDGTKQCWDETFKIPDFAPYEPQQ